MPAVLERRFGRALFANREAIKATTWPIYATHLACTSELSALTDNTDRELSLGLSCHRSAVDDAEGWALAHV